MAAPRHQSTSNPQRLLGQREAAGPFLDQLCHQELHTSRGGTLDSSAHPTESISHHADMALLPAAQGAPCKDVEVARVPRGALGAGGGPAPWGDTGVLTDPPHPTRGSRGASVEERHTDCRSNADSWDRRTEEDRRGGGGQADCRRRWLERRRTKTEAEVEARAVFVRYNRPTGAARRRPRASTSTSTSTSTSASASVV